MKGASCFHTQCSRYTSAAVQAFNKVHLSSNKSSIVQETKGSNTKVPHEEMPFLCKMGNIHGKRDIYHPVRTLSKMVLHLLRSTNAEPVSTNRLISNLNGQKSNLDSFLPNLIIHQSNAVIKAQPPVIWILAPPPAGRDTSTTVWTQPH